MKAADDGSQPERQSVMRPNDLEGVAAGRPRTDRCIKIKCGSVFCEPRKGGNPEKPDLSGQSCLPLGQSGFPRNLAFRKC